MSITIVLGVGSVRQLRIAIVGSGEMGGAIATALSRRTRHEIRLRGARAIALLLKRGADAGLVKGIGEIEFVTAR